MSIVHLRAMAPVTVTVDTESGAVLRVAAHDEASFFVDFNGHPSEDSESKLPAADDENGAPFAEITEIRKALVIAEEVLWPEWDIDQA
jgi:hypothetical protein